MAQLRWDARKGRLAYIVAETEAEIENLKSVSDHGAQIVSQADLWYLKVSWTTSFDQISCLIKQLDSPVCSCQY